MNRVAIFKSNREANSRATAQAGERFLTFRYKLSKLLSLLPDREKRLASAFEDSGLRHRFYRNLWNRAAGNLAYRYAEWGQGFWCVTDDDGNKVWGRIGNIGLDSAISLNLAGNKPLCHRLLADVPDYRAPRFCEFTVGSIDRARAFMADQQGPCVVKPARDTGAGFGVITGVNNQSALNCAAITASTHCKDLLIEEMITGDSYRLLFLNGEYLHGVRRDSPRVVGDGKSTVAQLITAENHRRQTGPRIVALFPIGIDQECRATLQSQSLTLNSRPRQGESTVVKHVVNQNAASENNEITEQVHSSIIATGARASARVGLEWSGVDVLTTDITRPLAETGGVINEINGGPGLHHHYLTAQNRDPAIAEKLLRYCMVAQNRPYVFQSRQ